MLLRLLALAFLTLNPSLIAAEPAADSALAARIARVESGLLPAARLTGDTSEPWTLARRLLVHRVPGVSVAVIADGQLAWARGYGVARVGDLAPVDADTLFQAASLSKPVAAAALLALVDAGKLTLDTDVNSVLTAWKIPAAPAAAGVPVTLRHLLSHTAGLAAHGADGYAPGAPGPTLLQILDGTTPAQSAPVRVDATPGTRWRYSGGGYTVAQQLAVDVSGEPFPALVRSRVLAPAGMDASTFEQPLRTTFALRAAAGHTAGSTRLPGDAHIYPDLAAAGLWTTPTDLARFALALRAALDGQPSFLSRATATAMITPTLADTNYGLGIGVIGSGETLQLAHSGSNTGFRSTFVFYPRLGRGAIVMTNSDNGGALIPEILRALAREYDWPDYRMVEKTAVPLTDSAVAAFSGRYERESTPVLAFRLNGHFYLRIGDRPRFEIFPQSDHEFFTLDSPDIWSFERAPTGLASHIVLRSSPPQLYRRLGSASLSPILRVPPRP